MTALLLPFLPDFTEAATETLTWQTSVSISVNGTESLRPTWALPRREYTFHLGEATGYNGTILEALRTHPDTVAIPLWCFSGKPPSQGLQATPGQLYAHHNGDSVIVTDSPKAPAGYAESAPIVQGYPDTELQANLATESESSATLRVRVPPYAEAMEPWDTLDQGLPLLPDFVHWNSGLDESLKRSENQADSNTALYTVEKRYGERFLTLPLILPNDQAVADLRRFLHHIQGAGRPFRFNATGTTRTWRLAEDAITINYEAGGTATTTLNLKDLGA